MPARRNKTYKRVFITKKHLRKYLVLSLLIIFGYIVVNTYSRGAEWGGEKKLNLVISGTENVTVVSLNPKDKEITSVLIPSDTEVEVARNLGRWKLGSVWQLGENEGVGGQLLAETVTRYFNIPTYSYIDDKGSGIIENDLLSLLTVLIYSADSNLSKIDLINIIRFAKSVKNIDKSIIDLRNSNLLRPEELKGGGMGYKKVRDLPQWVIAPFSHEDIASKLTTVKIVNNSNDRVISSKMGKVIEATGAKVAQIVNNSSEDGPCTIRSENREIGRYYAKLFECDYVDEIENSFDIVITINEDFVKRF